MLIGKERLGEILNESSSVAQTLTNSFLGVCMCVVYVCVCVQHNLSHYLYDIYIIYQLDSLVFRSM